MIKINTYLTFNGNCREAMSFYRRCFGGKNYLERITIDQLADKFAISRRNFERRFLKSTNNTVNEYMQRVKVEAAKRKLESSRKNVSEVMYEVGYTDTKTFRDVFKKITGLTPVEYRNKYNKPAVLN